MAVALRDVAKAAGVSVATVSMAMRNNLEIAQATRKKVLKTAKNLGYRPNASARALVSGRTDILGIVVKDLSYLAGPYMGAVVGGIAEVADNNGLGIMFARSNAVKDEGESEYLRMLKEGRIEGVIIIDQAIPESDLCGFSDVNVPAVLIDRKIPNARFPVVRIDYRKAVHRAVSFLVGLGHRRIAAVTPGTKLFGLAEKVAGYKEALEENGLPFDPELLKSGDECGWGIEEFQMIINNLTKLQNPPTTYMSFVDVRTLSLCEALRSCGLSIPEDVSVIGFDCTGMQDSITYSTAVISVPGHDMGIRACQLLQDVLSSKPVPEDVVLEASFKSRLTCASPGK